MYTLGFANKFYTLWDVQESPVYITDAYGNHHLSRVDTQYYYLKNVSFDKDVAMAKYPNTPLDEDLRGKTRDFQRTGNDERTTDIVWFGKYNGQLLTEIADKDFNYILWLHGNCAKYVNAIEALPQYQKHIADIADERASTLSKSFQWQQGIPINIIGKSNGYNVADWEEAGEDGSRYCWFKAELPNGEPVSIKVADCRLVGGMYPYVMPVINGRAMKTKNKAFTITPTTFKSSVYGTTGNYTIEHFITL